MPTFYNNVFATRNASISKCSGNRLLQVKIIGLLMLAIGSFYACSSYKNIDFQELKPARINIGDDFSNIYIYCKHIKDQELLRVIQTNSLPRIASVKFSKFLKLNLETTPQLYKTRIRILSHDSLLNFKSSAPGIVITTDWVEFFQVKKPYREDWIYGIVCSFNYSIFSKSNKTLLKKCQRKDTTWFKRTYLTNGVSIYDKFDACLKACEQAADECANYIVPHWVDKTRKYYYQPGAFSKAYKLIQKNDLDSSFKVLQDFCYKSTNPENKMKSLYNMAIVCELKDDIEKAHSLADSSLKIMNNDRSKEYSQILSSRKLDKNALDLQLK